MHRSTLRCLNMLCDHERVALSSVGRPALREMQPLLDSGVLAIMRSGAGQVLHVRNTEALRQFRQVYFPQQAPGTPYPAHAAAIRTLRNAKQAKSRDSALLLLRALRPVTCTLDGLPLSVCDITRTCGAVALVLDGQRLLSMNAEIALIENLECFLHAERMHLAADAAIYTAGCLSSLILQMLAAPSMHASTYLHCPDYDPVGLAEYMRYKNVLGCRVKLHRPADLRELLQKYGKPTLLQGRNGSIMQTLRRNATDDIREILQWMDEANAGLEQEILIRES